MSPDSVRISVVVAARPDQSDVAAVDAVLSMPVATRPFELLLVQGNQPSRQRNEAVAATQGDVVYFLDDDSVIDEGNLARIAAAFTKDQLAVLGGPNLCPTQATFWQRVFATVMGSRLSFGPSSARYRRVGQRRPSSEKELILCNLAFRKKEFEAAGGFDEALYPNEENALMDQLQQAGRTLEYDPELVVYRLPRRSVKGFLVMLFRYGRGRGEQVRRHPTIGSLPNFVPVAFIGYALLLLGSSWLPTPFREFIQWSGALYGVIALVWGLRLGLRAGLGVGLAAIPYLPIGHLIYGWGLLNGLVRTAVAKREKAEPIPVRIQRVWPVDELQP